MPRKETVGLMLRMSPELHDRLKEVAAEERRSLNAEITYRLEQAYKVKEVEKVAA